jgi:hypothetical protein
MAYVILFFVLYFSIAIENNAADAANESIYVIGGGADSCGKWLASKDFPHVRDQFTHWVLGFITGNNWARNQSQVYPPDGPAVAAFVDQYCRNHPLDRIFNAAEFLVTEMLQRKR